MVRPSEHSQEWAVTDPVQANPANAPTKIVVQPHGAVHLKSIVGEDGNPYRPPAEFVYAEAPPGQPDEEKLVESIVIRGDFEYRNRMTVSTRMLMPTRWETRVRQISTDTVIADVPWLLIGDGSGSKFGMGMKELLSERHNVPATVLHHQMSLGGHGHIGHEADLGVDVRSYGGRSLLHQTSETPPYHLAVCNPMDVGGVVTPGDAFDHDENSNAGANSETRPLWWPWARFVQKVELNLNDHALIHRVTEHLYALKEWNNDGVSGPLLGRIELGNALVGHTFDAAYIVNMSTAEVHPIVDFNVLTGNLQEWLISKLRYQHVENGIVTDLSTLPLVYAGPVAIILHETATNFSLGFAATLENTDGDDPDNHMAKELRAPNYVRIQQHTAAGAADPESAVTLRVDFLAKSIGKRKQGWISFQYFVITGMFVDMTQALVDLALSGDMGLPPQAPPSAATEGSGGAAYPVPVLDEVTTLPTGRKTTRFKQWCLMRPVIQDPSLPPTHMVAITRASQALPGPRSRVLSSPDRVTWLQPVPVGPLTGETETAITKSVDKGNRRYRNTIWVGNRSQIVLRQRTEIMQITPPLVLHDVSWMADGPGGAHTGQSVQLASFIFEFPSTGFDLLSNANSGGQGGENQEASWTIYGSAPIFYSPNDKPALTALGEFEVAVYPVDFLTNLAFDGSVSPIQNHGGTVDMPVLYYGMRHFQSYRLHFRGHPTLHRYDCWEHRADENNNKTRPFRDNTHLAWSHVNSDEAGWDELYVRDVATGVQRQLTPYLLDPSPTAPTFRSFTKNGTIEGFVDLFTSVENLTFGPPDVPSGYACVIRRNSVTDFCIANIVKLYEDDGDVKQQISASAHRLVRIEITSSLNTGPPFGPGVSTMSFNSTRAWMSSHQLRPRGWCGFPMWQYCGEFADLAATLDEAFAAGWFDEPARTDLPHKVISGTGFTGVSGEDGPIIEELR